VNNSAAPFATRPGIRTRWLLWRGVERHLSLAGPLSPAGASTLLLLILAGPPIGARGQPRRRCDGPINRGIDIANIRARFDGGQQSVQSFVVGRGSAPGTGLASDRWTRRAGSDSRCLPRHEAALILASLGCSVDSFFSAACEDGHRWQRSRWLSRSSNSTATRWPASCGAS
jgi:hypothetical protein